MAVVRRVRGRAAVRTWLCRIAINACLTALERIRLAFVAALQYLSARQRAVLIMRDVLDWPAAEAAELLGMTTTR